MNLEKFSLILFIRYLRDFHNVKQHLFAALKECLRAMSVTVHITKQMTAHSFLLGRIRTLESVFNKIESLLAYSVSQLGNDWPSVTAGPEASLKENVVTSIISVIDEEIEKLTNSQANNKDLKIEALTTVKTVLDQHLAANTNTARQDIVALESPAAHNAG